ncbi:MAG TPA: extracellular solute-binding protein [Anaerolineales bacterium]|nr:extracellular solute-binding protein [Anaerolineales bacterium]
MSRTPATTNKAPSPTRPSAPVLDLHGVGIEIWHPWYGPESGLIDSQIAEFNRDNEWGITVRGQGHTSFTEMWDHVNDSLQAGAGPQLAIALPEHAVAWDAANHVVDLTPYINDLSYGLSQDGISDFPGAFWEQDLAGDRQLALPAERSATFLTYNETWARKLGFSKPPVTAQQFRDQACAAHAALGQDSDPSNDGRGGWLIRTDGATFLSWLTAFGGGVLDGTGYRFLTPRNLEATVFLKQLYDDGCAWLAPADEDQASRFAAREALFGTAALEDLTGVGRAMAGAENADEWTVLPFPGADRAVLQVYGASFVVLKSTPQQQLASWLFLRWMLAPEQQGKWVEVTGLFPIRTSMQSTLAGYTRSHPQWAAAVSLLGFAQGYPQLASWRQVRVIMADGFDAMYRANTPAGRVAEILAIMDRTARDVSP